MKNTYYVTYKKEFPVDEWNRPGALYSLADVPIRDMKVLERKGYITAKDDSMGMVKVKDLEPGYAIHVWVDKRDVKCSNPDTYINEILNVTAPGLLNE
tara:strand:+ start:1899 stop:2192 length:294 start_codon:yes stop_codon:yes gene_type:complete